MLKLQFSWHYELKGPAKIWAASITFTIVGALITFILPLGVTVEPDSQADPEAIKLLVRIFGSVFFVPGFITFCLMLVGLRIKRTSPHNLHVWHWWLNFLGGLFGACAFAVPSTALFPIFLIFYMNRPNALFPDETTTKNLWIMLVFSLVGAVVLVGVIFLARYQIHNRPRWQSNGGVSESAESEATGTE